MYTYMLHEHRSYIQQPPPQQLCEDAAGISNVDQDSVLVQSQLQSDLDRLKDDCCTAYARYLPPQLVAAYIGKQAGARPSIVSQAAATRAGLLYPYVTHLSNAAPPLMNLPVNRPWYHQYKRTRESNTAPPKKPRGTFPHTPYINIQDVLRKITLFAADFVGDLYFERCRLLNFQPSVVVATRLRMRRGEEGLRLSIKLIEQLFAFFTSPEAQTEQWNDESDRSISRRMWQFRIQVEDLYACQPHFALN